MASEDDHFEKLLDVFRGELRAIKDRLVWVLVVLALVAAELGIGLAIP